jgi:hypothetical protein
MLNATMQAETYGDDPAAMRRKAERLERLNRVNVALENIGGAYLAGPSEETHALYMMRKGFSPAFIAHGLLSVRRDVTLGA